MEYRYAFATGTEAVEISGEWAAVLEEMDHEEQLSNRRETRRHQSLDELLIEGIDFAGEDNAEIPLLAKELAGELQQALQTLTEVQRKRLILHCQGLTYREIAKREGADFKSCEESVMAGLKKLKRIMKKIFKDTPTKGHSRGY